VSRGGRETQAGISQGKAEDFAKDQKKAGSKEWVKGIVFSPSSSLSPHPFSFYPFLSPRSQLLLGRGS
jgi:hypothetical protein